MAPATSCHPGPSSQLGKKWSVGVAAAAAAVVEMIATKQRMVRMLAPGGSARGGSRGSAGLHKTVRGCPQAYRGKVQNSASPRRENRRRAVAATPAQ